MALKIYSILYFFHSRMKKSMPNNLTSWRKIYIYHKVKRLGWNERNGRRKIDCAKKTTVRMKLIEYFYVFTLPIVHIYVILHTYMLRSDKNCRLFIYLLSHSHMHIARMQWLAVCRKSIVMCALLTLNLIIICTQSARQLKGGTQRCRDDERFLFTCNEATKQSKKRREKITKQ